MALKVKAAEKKIKLDKDTTNPITTVWLKYSTIPIALSHLLIPNSGF